MSKFNKLYESLMNDQEKWSKEIKVKTGRMHRLLGIPQGKKIIDVYSSGITLAKDLLKAVNGNKKQASSMLAFAANVDKDNNVLDKALHAIKKL